MQKEILLEILTQNQTTCSTVFHKITPQNAAFRLNEQAASAGFIYRHIGETINLFGLFFGIPTTIQNTTMGKSDNGQGRDIEASRLLIEQGFDWLRQYIETTPDSAWLDPIDTPFFGTVSRARLFSHILSHNSHHAGQLALTLNRGSTVSE
ncbi:DinB family protein [Spirosoma sp. SC4-14]|uniref:DinB family protein n=1 Tax=Spirosoma sp. SC4-14 TaxID=3128900 RepID=UPI0030CA5CF7